MKIELAYGRNGLSIDLPKQNVKYVLELPELPSLLEPRVAVRAALRNPIASSSLEEIARGRRDAVIVVSDITRPVPNHIILSPVLDALFSGGLTPQNVLILIATGLHRPNTDAELLQMLGEQVVASGCRIENHEARNADAHVYVGDVAPGMPVHVDRRYVGADLKILTGLVEPHFMAGLSGGRKSICPGLCSAETIMQFHRPELMEAPEGYAGNIKNNPVHAEALAVADLAGGADFIVNVTMDRHRNLTGVFAGEMRAAHAAAVSHGIAQSAVYIDEPVDVVITSAAGYPLDLTFYQGIKGIGAAAPIVKHGGTVIIAHECSEGIGGPEFTDIMLATDDPHGVIREAITSDTRSIDLWQLHKLELVLRRARVLSYSTSIDDDTQRSLFVEPIHSIEDAVAECIEQYGPDTTIAVMPEGPYVLPMSK